MPKTNAETKSEFINRLAILSSRIILRLVKNNKANQCRSMGNSINNHLRSGYLNWRRKISGFSPRSDYIERMKQYLTSCFNFFSFDVNNGV